MKKGDHRPRNSAQYEGPDFRSCLMIDLGRETDGNNEICLGVRFALCVMFLKQLRSTVASL